MEIELHPTVSLLPETLSILVAPVEMLAGDINSHPECSAARSSSFSGNYSRVLSRLVENDPLLYKDAKEMVEYLAQALKQTSREATVLLYAPALDPRLQKMTELADRVFCIYNEPAAAKSRKVEAKMPGEQATLEAYS